MGKVRSPEQQYTIAADYQKTGAPLFTKGACVENATVCFDPVSIFTASSIADRAIALKLLPATHKTTLLNKLKNLFQAYLPDRKIDTNEESEALETIQSEIDLYVIEKIFIAGDKEKWALYTLEQAQILLKLFKEPADTDTQTHINDVLASMDLNILLDPKVFKSWLSLSSSNFDGHFLWQMGILLLENSAHEGTGEELICSIIKQHDEIIRPQDLSELFEKMQKHNFEKISALLLGDKSPLSPAPITEKLLAKSLENENLFVYSELLKNSVLFGHPASLARVEELLITDKNEILLDANPQKNEFNYSMETFGQIGTLFFSKEHEIPGTVPAHLSARFKATKTKLFRTLPLVYRQDTPHATRLLNLLACAKEGIRNLEKFEKSWRTHATPLKKYTPLTFENIAWVVQKQAAEIHVPQVIHLLETLARHPLNDRDPPWDDADPLLGLKKIANHFGLGTFFALNAMKKIALREDSRDMEEDRDGFRPHLERQQKRALDFFANQLEVENLVSFVEATSSYHQVNDELLVLLAQYGFPSALISRDMNDAFYELLCRQKEDASWPVLLKSYDGVAKLAQSKKGSIGIGYVFILNELEEKNLYQDRTPSLVLESIILNNLPASFQAWEVLSKFAANLWKAEGPKTQTIQDISRKKAEYLMHLEQIATHTNEHSLDAIETLIQLAKKSQDPAIVDLLKKLDITVLKTHLPDQQMTPPFPAKEENYFESIVRGAIKYFTPGKGETDPIEPMEKSMESKKLPSSLDQSNSKITERSRAHQLLKDLALFENQSAIDLLINRSQEDITADSISPSVPFISEISSGTDHEKEGPDEPNSITFEPANPLPVGPPLPENLLPVSEEPQRTVPPEIMGSAGNGSPGSNASSGSHVPPASPDESVTPDHGLKSGELISDEIISFYNPQLALEQLYSMIVDPSQNSSQNAKLEAMDSILNIGTNFQNLETTALRRLIDIALTKDLETEVTRKALDGIFTLTRMQTLSNEMQKIMEELIEDAYQIGKDGDVLGKKILKRIAATKHPRLSHLAETRFLDLQFQI